MSHIQAVAVVDLKTRAVQLATELSTRDQFWLAAQELLTFKLLPPTEFLRQSRKIVTLIEISKARLTESNIPLSKRVICTPGHEPYRAIYIQLLEALQVKQHLIEDENLRLRVQRLVLPLTHTSVASGSIKVTGGPVEEDRQAVLRGHSSRYQPYERPQRHACRARSETPKRDISMPPPDVLPLASKKPKAPDLNIFDLTTALEEDDNSSITKGEPSEILVAVPSRGRMRGRFGIFCTSRRR